MNVMADKPKQPRDRASDAAYWAGWRAWQDGFSIDDNPFIEAKRKSERRSWFDGFLGARLETLNDTIAEKWGV
jgi:hypothetical protein